MIGLKTPYKISLDFYKRNVVTVNAKQLDHNSRYIEITCTDNGKKVVLDNTTTSAYVRFRKTDGHNVLNEVEITDSGIVNVELTQQMLMVSGQNTVDIMFIQTSDENKALIENLEDIIDNNNSGNFSVLSTMSFYVNTEATAIDHGEVISSDEYDALTNGLANTKDAINNANIQASNAEKWANEAEEWAGKAEDATVYANTQGDYAKEQGDEAYNQSEQAKFQATRASEAADKIDAIIAGEVVMKDEKGVANGVATLDDSALIPNEQINTLFDETEIIRELINSGDSLSVILKKIYAYMITINSMSQKHSDSINNLPILTTASSSPIDGDAYEVNYNTGVTINPSEKSVNASSFSASEKITIGNIILEHKDIDSENRLVISFI